MHAPILSTHSIFSTLGLLFLAGLLPASRQVADQQASRMRVLSISDLLLRGNPPRPPRLGTLNERQGEIDAPMLNLLSDREFLSMDKDQLLDLVRGAGGDAADEVSMVVRGEALLVSGDREPVAKIEQIVNSLRQAVTQSFTVHAKLYEIAAENEYPAVASAAELAALTKDRPLVWSGQTTTRTGQQVALGQESYARYVRDVDIEVAEESAIGKPVTASLFAGIRLVCESHALIASTDRVFKCQFALSELDGPIRLQRTGVRELPVIGVPHLRSTSGSFSGRVGHDGALLVSIRSRSGAGSNLLLVVQPGVESGPAPTEVSAGRTLLLPISALTSPSLQFAPPFVPTEDDPEQARGGYPELLIEDDGDNDRGETLLNLLRQSLGRMLEQEDDATVDITSNGVGHGFILIRGSEQLRTAARSHLTELQNRWIQTLEIATRTDLSTRLESAGTFAGAGLAPETLFHGVTFPCLVGNCGLIFKGVESTVVRDSNVEIATKTSLSKPVVQTIFSGVTIGVRPTLQGNSPTANLRLDLTYIPEPERQASAQEKGCDLYHVTVNRVQFRHFGTVRFGQKIDLGWGPIVPDQQASHRMLQSVRFRKL